MIFLNKVLVIQDSQDDTDLIKEYLLDIESSTEYISTITGGEWMALKFAKNQAFK